MKYYIYIYIYIYNKNVNSRLGCIFTVIYNEREQLKYRGVEGDIVGGNGNRWVEAAFSIFLVSILNKLPFSGTNQNQCSNDNVLLLFMFCYRIFYS